MRVVECGVPWTVVTTVTIGDIEITAPPPPDEATHLLYAAFVSQTSAGLEVAIHNELAWVDSNIAASSGDLDATRIPIVRDRSGVAQISAYYYAGLDGRGEPLRLSALSDRSWMRLYIFIAGSELPSGGRAAVRGCWGRLVS